LNKQITNKSDMKSVKMDPHWMEAKFIQPQIGVHPQGAQTDIHVWEPIKK